MRQKVMATSRRSIKLTINKADLARLESIARSRTEPAGRVERSRILLAYRQDPSFYAVGQTMGLHAQTVQRCIERAKAEGALACRKAKELGYPHEVWTTRLLADHARTHGPAEGHSCLSELAQGTVCKILDAQEVKPHKVRYYLERRDPEFKAKMAQVLCVYRKVKVLKKAAAVATKKNGERLKVTYMDRLAPPPKATAAQIRTVSAWGAAKQADLARLRVGLAGAGRVGGFI